MKQTACEMRICVTVNDGAGSGGDANQMRADGEAKVEWVVSVMTPRDAVVGYGGAIV
jgi:hypothetical protein